MWSSPFIRNANNPINWDCEWGAGGEDVDENINDGYRDSSDLTVLQGFDDWEKLAQDGVNVKIPPRVPSTNIGSSGEMLSSNVLQSNQELDYDTFETLSISYTVSLGPSREIVLSPGANITVSIKVVNDGDSPSTITLLPSSSSWFDVTSLPAQVPLDASESAIYIIEISVPSNASVGDVQELRVKASPNESANDYDIASIGVYVGPMARFEVDRIVGRIPLEVSFSDRSVGSITSWSWDFGDGTTSTLQNPTHTYTEEDKYTVSLTVLGPDGSDTFTLANPIWAFMNRSFIPVVAR
jgi:hypothetical protein